MMARVLLRFILTLFALGFFCSCNAFDNGEPDEVKDDGVNNTGNVVTIYAVQQGEIEVGTRVSFRKVLVTSPIGEDSGGFFIKELDGGPYSGIYVYVNREILEDLNIVVGDVVNIAGTYDEYNDVSELTLDAIGDYEILDNFGDPESDPVDPEELADPDTAEQWEGCLIRFEDIEVTNENPDAPSDYGEFEVTGSVRVDDFFYAYGFDPNPPLDTHFDALIGCFTFSFETYKLCPRFAADFVGDWEPPPNDGEFPEVTIQEIQQGEIASGTLVKVKGVITSPVNYSGDTFFIGDPDGGPYSGIAVYMYDEVVAIYEGQVGDAISLTAVVTEFYDFTELTLKNPGDFTIDGTADLPEPAVVGLDEIGEEWESVLIEIQDVTVTGAPNSYGEFSVGDGDSTVSVDDLFLEPDHWANYPITEGNTFGSIIGILNYSYEAFRLSPRNDADLEPAK